MPILTTAPSRASKTNNCFSHITSTGARSSLQLDVSKARAKQLPRAAKQRTSVVRMRALAEESVREANVEDPQSGDYLWLNSAAVFLFACLVPNLVLAAFFDQVTALPAWQILAVLLVVDSVGIAGIEGFLRVGEAFGRQRHGDVLFYPGPWVRTSFHPKGPYDKTKLDRKPPKFFSQYVQVLPFATGVVMPLGVTLAVPLIARGNAFLSASVIVPYLYTIIAQLQHEKAYVRKGSAMWPQVPVSHMLYRYLQLGRGAWLVGALHGPLWLHWLITYLACVWTFNFGCVMSWMQSMLYWHRQVEK